MNHITSKNHGIKSISHCLNPLVYLSTRKINYTPFIRFNYIRQVKRKQIQDTLNSEQAHKVGVEKSLPLKNLGDLQLMIPMLIHVLENDKSRQQKQGNMQPSPHNLRLKCCVFIQHSRIQILETWAIWFKKKTLGKKVSQTMIFNTQIL